MLLCIPAAGLHRPRRRAVYVDLIAQLPPTTRFVIVVADDAVGALGDLLVEADASGRATLVPAPPDLDFSAWAQDPFVVVDDGAGLPHLLEPYFFGRQDDGGIAGLLTRRGLVASSRTSLCFQGGHVLVGDDFVLVGRDCLDATLVTLSEDYGAGLPPDDARTAFGAELFRQALDPARRIVFVGTDLDVPRPTSRPTTVRGGERVELLHSQAGITQPLAHLDLFIALAGRGASGRYRLVVGSPTLADEILDREPLHHAMAALFDDVATRLRDEGFEVLRNPLPLTYGDGRARVDGAMRDVRSWYFASANNCMVQIDDAAGNAVWLPTYGHGAWRELAAIDAANQDLWADLGFTVHALADYHVFAQKLGAVHCIVKDLRRGR